MPTDPRLTQHNGSSAARVELLEEIERVSEKAGAASRILGDELVKKYFEDKINFAFIQFCDLPESATIEQYRAIHLPTKAIMDFRDSLRTLIDQKNRLIEEAESFEHQT